MNEATASGILGSDAKGTVRPGACDFVDKANYFHIRVIAAAAPLRSYLNLCKSGVETLKAIGNEAVACDGEGSEQVVIGRVREQVFILRLKASFSKTQLRERVKLAADLVAGNLF